MDQVSSSRPRALVRAGCLFLAVGTLELIAGLLINPTLLLIAVHDIAGDGFSLLAYDRTDQWLQRSQHHFLNCILRKSQNLVLPPLVFGWALLVYYLEPPGAVTVTACIITVVIAVINFTCNLIGHRWLHEAAEMHHHSAKIELLGDMLAAPIAAVGSILAVIWQAEMWNVWASRLILAVIAVLMLYAVVVAVWSLITHNREHDGLGTAASHAGH